MFSLITRKGWVGHFIALIAGALTPLFLAPFNIWPIAFVCVACFYLGLKELSVKQALVRSWFFGSGSYLSGVSWIYVSIHTFGNAPIWLAAGLTIIFCMLVAFFFVIPALVWVKWFRTNHTYFIDAFAFAGLWAIQEWFRGWFLTGFPWLYVGYSQLDAPLAGFAPIGGVWLISFIIALISVLLVKLVDYKQHHCKAVIGFVFVIVLFISGTLLNKIHWTTPLSKKLPVLLVQGNIDQEQKWQSSFFNDQLKLYWELTLKYQQPNSLVIWPENAIPFLKEDVQNLLDTTIGEYESKKNSALISGIPIREQNSRGEYRFYNGITVAGEGYGSYLKQKLVPFGEYVPLEEMLRGLITFFNLPMSDFSRGGADQPLLNVKGYQIAPFICYEVVYPDFVASMGGESNALITISNDTWFGHSIGPKQHLQMAQMRALEADRWMARATNNGITAIIDNKGIITKVIPSFEVGILKDDIPMVSGKTPYQVWYSYFVLVISFLSLMIALIINKRRKE